MKLLALIEKTKKGKFKRSDVYRLYMPRGGEDGVLIGWRADWPEGKWVEFRGPAYSKWVGGDSDFEKVHDALAGMHATVLHTNSVLDILPGHERYEIIKRAIDDDEVPAYNPNAILEVSESNDWNELPGGDAELDIGKKILYKPRQEHFTNGLNSFAGEIDKGTMIASPNMIDVRHNAKKGGIGRGVMKDFERWAYNRGARKVTSGYGAWEGAQGFWQKLGYDVNDKPNRNDAYHFSKELSEAQLLELRSSELQEIRRIMNDGNVEELYLYLSQNGWDEIDSGLFSRALSKVGSPYIIKVLKRSLNLKGNETLRGALQWLRYSQKNHLSNPYLPKVYYIQTMRTDGGETIYLIVVETLRQVGEDGYMNVMLSGKDVQERAYIAASLLIHNTVKRSLSDTAIQLVLDYATDRGIGNEYNQDGIIRLVFEDAVDAGFPLAKTMEMVGNANGNNDLHSGNIMMRPGTGELVINDPFIG